MATTIEDLHRIVAAQKTSGRNYMMMETGGYTRELLYCQDLHSKGLFGNITFLRGAYYQDLEGDYPEYWKGVPPMHYITHAIGPLLGFMQTRATQVSCLGSSRLRPDIQQPGKNPFPLQTALFTLEGTDVVAEITHSWFQVARGYTEAFCVYGDKRSFEWQQVEEEDPVLFSFEEDRPKHRRNAVHERVTPPFRPDLLPSEIARFASGGHGGSHPHLVHEFISSIVEHRAPVLDAITSADWCAPGICAHESSLANGKLIAIPSFG
jgi:predicted dehydrogenase